MLKGHILRSGDQFGVEQELWAQLTAYQLLRTAMVAAAESRPGTDPDRAGFTTALETAREELTLARGIIETGQEVDLVGTIGRAVLNNLLDERRPRFNVRKVKSPISRYHARPKGDERPLTSTSITRVGILVHAGNSIPPAEAESHDSQDLDRPLEQADVPSVPAPLETEPPSGSRQQRVLALLHADPYRIWRGREVAHALGVTNLNSFCVQMSQWAHRGLLRKTGPATYTLTA
jgi:hypothetical protein